VKNTFLKASATMHYSETGNECVSLGLDRLLLEEETVSNRTPSPKKAYPPADTLSMKGEDQA